MRAVGKLLLPLRDSQVGSCLNNTQNIFGIVPGMNYLCDKVIKTVSIMKYWINHNGVQSGPVDLEGLKEMGLTSAAYVWHEGLSDWVKITQLPELQGLYEMVTETVQPEAVAQAAVAPQQAAPVQPVQPQPETSEPCPPTNLVWAIITTVLCCIPPGIVAIFYALKVSNKYREGDIEGAKRASETGAWWCIAAIILGIVSMPLGFIMMSAGAS